MARIPTTTAKMPSRINEVDVDLSMTGIPFAVGRLRNGLRDDGLGRIEFGVLAFEVQGLPPVTRQEPSSIWLLAAAIAGTKRQCAAPGDPGIRLLDLPAGTWRPRRRRWREDRS